MSMKFLSGLQDLLGMYDAAVPTMSNDTQPGSSSSVSAPSHLQQLQSPSTPIPPIFTREQPVQRKRSVQEVNRVEAASSKKEEEPIRRCSHNRNVHFPADELLITGYHEAPRSPFITLLADGTTSPAKSPVIPDPDEMILEYRRACRSFNTRPLQMVINQIKCFHRVPGVRQECLSLKGERVGLEQMEALEAILQRTQFEQLDFEYTFLDDETAISLGEMIEFYDSTHRLNLSFNKGIAVRGWNAIFKAVRNCSSLNVLNLRYTSLSDKSIPALSRTVRANPPIAMSCLHLENVSLSGKNLLMVVCALKANLTVKELYLGENSMQPSDGAYLYQLIISNCALQMLDLRNNLLQDQGLRHVCDALRHADTKEKSALSALVLWNNRLTGQSMGDLAQSLIWNDRLETLNIGCNRLGMEGIQGLKRALQDTKCNLHRLGLQSTALDCQAAIELAECLAENTSMVRVDLRDNSAVGSAGLLALHSAMKMNKTITLLNIDSSTANVTSQKTKPYQEEFRRLYDQIREACERNKATALAAMTAHVEEVGSPVVESTPCIEVNGIVNEEEEKKENMEMNGIKTEEEEDKSTVEEKKENGMSEPSTSNGEVIVEKNEEKERKHSSKMIRKLHKFTRSSSLTCTETVVDIHERIREMSNSSSSLDEASDPDSNKTIKKSEPIAVASSLPTIIGGELAKRTGWTSLPSLVDGSPSLDTTPVHTVIGSAPSPVVRKMRRFSVSPTSSTFELGPTLKSSSTFTAGVTTTPRPRSLDLFNPSPTVTTSSSSPGPSQPSSAPVLLTPPEYNPFQNVRSPIPEKFRVSVATTLPVSPFLTPVEEMEREREVKSVVTDLVNYIVYEEQSQVERKKSMLLTTTGPPPRLPSPARDIPKAVLEENEESNPQPVETPNTPSRMLSVASELSTRLSIEADDVVIRSVVHALCREVGKAEKLAELKKS